MKENPEQLLQEGNTIQFVPNGFSMYPLFDPRRPDQAIVEPVGDRKLKRGDVVLFRRDGKPEETDAQGNRMGILVIHRIAKVRGQEIFCVGDNQYLLEGPLRPDQVKGVLTGRVRGGKTLPVTALSYRIITGLWLFLLPLRRPVFACVKGVHRLLGRK